MSIYILTLLQDEKGIITKAVVDTNQIEGVGKIPYLESIKKIMEEKGILRKGKFKKGDYALNPHFFFSGNKPMLTLKAAVNMASQLKKGMDKKNGIDNEYKRVDCFDMETCFIKYGKEVTKEYLSRYDEEDVVVIQTITTGKEREESLELFKECKAGLIFVVGNGSSDEEEEVEVFSEEGFEVHRIEDTGNEYFWKVFQKMLKYYEIKLKKETFKEVFYQVINSVGDLVCEELFHRLVKRAKDRSEVMKAEISEDDKRLFENLAEKDK